MDYQAPLPMGFFRQEYWSGLPFPSPGDLPKPGIELASCIGRWIVYNLATREAPSIQYMNKKLYTNNVNMK